MDQSEVKDYRITVTAHAKRGGGHVKLLKDLTAVGFRVVADKKDHVAGLIPTNQLDALAAVPEIALKIDEEFQLSPIETQAT